MFRSWPYVCANTDESMHLNSLCAAETVNSLPGKGEVCTATSAMIALHCASQQLVSDSCGPVVACYYAFAKSVTALLQYLANRSNANANPVCR